MILEPFTHRNSIRSEHHHRNRSSLPEWLRSEIDFLRQTSRLLYAKREPSLYGNEAADLSPDEVMGRQDAEDGVKRARKTHKTCLKLIKELEGIQKSATFQDL